jgi:hypothetical protein
MKMTFPIIALAVGCIAGSYGSAADNPVSVGRAQRAESNAAIKAHDAIRPRKLFDDDYHGINRTSGALDSGGDAAARSYADEVFKDPTFVTYRRTPTSSNKSKAEQGRHGSWKRIKRLRSWLARASTHDRRPGVDGPTPICEA